MSKPNTSVEPLAYETVGGTDEYEAADAVLSFLDSEEEEPSGTDGIEPESEEEEGDVEVEDEGADEELEDEAEDEESDEDEEDEQDAEEPDSEPTFKVTVDGEEVEVTQSELLAGYSRTSDYTRKTQAVAEQRKAVEAERQQLLATREQQAQRLAQIEEVLTQLQPAEPDWARLRQENPAEFAAQWAEHQQRQGEMEQIRSQRVQLEQQNAVERQQQLRGVLEAEKQKLVAAIPEWNDPEVASKEKAELANFAKGLGYTDEDLKQVYDHRLMLILRKAAAFDKVSARKQEVVKTKKAEPKKVLQPGVRQKAPKDQKSKSERARALSRLNRTGSVRDAAAAIELMLD